MRAQGKISPTCSNEKASHVIYLEKQETAVQKSPLPSPDIDTGLDLYILILPSKPFVIKWASSIAGLHFALVCLVLSLTCLPDLAYLCLCACFFSRIWGRHLSKQLCRLSPGLWVLRQSFSSHA